MRSYSLPSGKGLNSRWPVPVWTGSPLLCPVFSHMPNLHAKLKIIDVHAKPAGDKRRDENSLYLNHTMCTFTIASCSHDAHRPRASTGFQTARGIVPGHRTRISADMDAACTTDQTGCQTGEQARLTASEALLHHVCPVIGGHIKLPSF